MPSESNPISRTVVAIAVVAIIIAASAGAFLLLLPGGDRSDKLQVVATFYPLYFLSSEIGGDRAEVHTLIPDNIEPHSWEPSPSDLIKVSEAQILLYNGVGFEPWMEDFLSSVDNPELLKVDTSQKVSFIPSETITEPYEEAVVLLATGPNNTVVLTPSVASAAQVEAFPQVLEVQMTDVPGGKGGCFSLNVTEGGDYRLLVTDGAEFTVSYLNGTAVEVEIENGPISWYPQFSSSQFFDFEGGAAYLVSFSPSAATSARMVVIHSLSEHEEGEGHHHGLNDPHFWLDPLSAKVQVQNILEAFQQADPANGTYYAGNAASLSAKLGQLDLAFHEGLKNRTKNTIITTHEGFNYLAYRYGFEAYAAIGISADQQPSPQDLARLTDLVEDLGLHYVFSEPVFSDSVIQTIAAETGAQVLILDGLHGRTGVHKGMDYFEMMYSNLDSLKVGLEVVQ